MKKLWIALFNLRKDDNVKSFIVKHVSETGEECIGYGVKYFFSPEKEEFKGWDIASVDVVDGSLSDEDLITLCEQRGFHVKTVP